MAQELSQTPDAQRARERRKARKVRDDRPDPEAASGANQLEASPESWEAAPSGEPPSGDQEAVEAPAPRKRGRPSKAALEAAKRASEIAEEARVAAEAGAGIAYTIAGTGLQVIGFQVAGYVMQSQAESAGKKIADGTKGTRLYGAFQKIGTGGDLAPLIVGPLLAEAYCRFEYRRAQLLPMLGLVVPDDALATIVELYPVPAAMAPPPPADGAGEAPATNGAAVVDEEALQAAMREAAQAGEAAIDPQAVADYRSDLWPTPE